MPGEFRFEPVGITFVFENILSFFRRKAAISFCLALASFVSLPAHAEIGAYVVVDARTGDVLDQKDATRKWYPASLTKMMTAYVTLKAIREGKATLSSVVIQSKNSLSEPPSKMGFKVGTKLTIDAALKIIMIKSANDVSVALAEAIAGSEGAFIDMMNAEAKRLGMADTAFFNPHGLPDNRQVSSAQDMALLAMALRSDFPEAQSYYKHPGIVFGKKTLRSANREFLLRVPGADGMKTGYICNSGYNVAASATRRGRTVIVVVLGAASGLERIAFSRDALDKAFKKRRGKVKLANLPRRGGNPPADRYCKRNPKPGADGIMARYDMHGQEKSSLLSFGAAAKAGAVIIPGLRTNKQESKVDGGSIKLANGKIDWVKVMDRTIGPRRIAYAPVTVRTGVPSGAGQPLALQNAAGIPVPVPFPNPQRVAEVVPVTDTPPSSVREPDERAPGSLFLRGEGFAVPVPGPSPKR